MSDPPVQPVAVTVYSKDDHILLLPEHTNGMIPQVCYAKITKVELGKIFAATKKLPNLPSSAVAINSRLHQPTVVTQAEFKGSQVGVWLRKGVMTLTTEERFHGQVVDYVNRPAKLVVRTRLGDMDMRPDEVAEVAGPVALILFGSQFVASAYTVDRLYEIHDTIMKRIKGSFPSMPPMTDPTEVYDDLVDDASLDAVEWINPITGVKRPCRPQHVLHAIRWEDNIEDKPEALIIGPQWCADPGYEPRVTVVVNPVDPVRRIMHYQTKSRQAPSESDTVPDDLPQEDPEQHEAAISEQDDELEEKPEVYSNDFDDDDLSEVSHLTEQMLRPVNSLRDYANIDQAHEAASVTRNKDLFYPTKEDMLMFRATHHRRFHKLTIMYYMKVLMQDDSVPFLAYPAMMIDIVTGNFGLIGVTGTDFRVITATARSEFQRKSRDGVRSYGASAKHFDAEPITDLQDMARCYGNISDYYQDRGSPVTKAHFVAVQKVALSLTTDECSECDVVAAAVKRVDNCNLATSLQLRSWSTQWTPYAA